MYPKPHDLVIVEDTNEGCHTEFGAKLSLYSLLALQNVFLSAQN